MASISDVVVPDEFYCPIRYEVLIDPVRTDCQGYSSNFFKRTFQRIFSPSSFQGHVFESLALASWRVNHNTCPFCRHRIQKVTPDREMARKIAEQFVAASEQNKAYFENAKQELDEEMGYDHVRHLIVSSSQNSFREDFYRFSHHPLRTMHEILLPQRAVEEAILQDDLDRAERVAQRFSNYRNFWRLSDKDFVLKCIAEAYINRNYSASNLRNAFRLIQTISWPSRFSLFNYGSDYNASEKDDLLKQIFEKHLLNNNLQMAENIADRMTSDDEKNQCYSSIATVYLARDYSDSNLEAAKRLVGKMTPRTFIIYRVIPSGKNNLLIKIAFKYAQNNKLIDAVAEAKKIDFLIQRFIIIGTVYVICGYAYWKMKLNQFSTSIKNVINRIRA